MKLDENGAKLAQNQPKMGKSTNFHDTLTSLRRWTTFCYLT
jgi:hypothetical protein